MPSPSSPRTLVPYTTLLLMAVTACSDSETQAGETATGRAIPSVYVVNYPLQYFGERIGGDAVEVRLPAPTDEDPAYWKPDAETVALYQDADLILLNGAGYAGWITSAVLPLSAIVDTSKTFADRYIQIEDAVTHTHGPGGEHSHGTTAFTTWLDLTLALEQAITIRDALGQRLPDQQQAFEDRFQALEQDLLDLDRELASIVVADPRRPLLGSHPVYQYLARRYDLNLRSVHWEPDQMPGDEEWKNLEAVLAEHPARVMLWEGNPSGEITERLSGLGVESVVFDPCGNAPQQGDFLVVMRQNVQNLRRAFQ